MREDRIKKDMLKRDLIIKAARSCFLEKGIMGTRVCDIGEYSGLSVGSIYNIFKSKEEIILESTDLDSDIFNISDTDKENFGGVAIYINKEIRRVIDLHTGVNFSLYTELLSLASRNDAISKYMNRKKEELHGRASIIIMLGQSRGEIDKHIDVSRRASALVCSVEAARLIPKINPRLDGKSIMYLINYWIRVALNLEEERKIQR
ncbi:MAG: helix-turn-helix domain containing protein [Azospirillaceae bacterium]|nr:helix-turn-helix domain containing protein [Azospirillaceae bacterium]